MTALIDRFKNEVGQITENPRRRLGGLVSDERGVSAVEFAMLLPLMLSLYLGAVAVSQGIGADRKVTLTPAPSRTWFQVTGVSNNDMTIR